MLIDGATSAKQHTASSIQKKYKKQFFFLEKLELNYRK